MYVWYGNNFNFKQCNIKTNMQCIDRHENVCSLRVYSSFQDRLIWFRTKAKVKQEFLFIQNPIVWVANYKHFLVYMRWLCFKCIMKYSKSGWFTRAIPFSFGFTSFLSKENGRAWCERDRKSHKFINRLNVFNKATERRMMWRQNNAQIEPNEIKIWMRRRKKQKPVQREMI